jgi:hypothetical protein
VTQYAKSFLTATLVCLIALAFVLSIARVPDLSHHYVTLGSTSVDLSLIAAMTSMISMKLLFLAGYILFVIQGFRTHWGWGVANLLLSPIAALIFLFLHPQRAKIPAFLCGLALVILILTLIYFRASYGASNHTVQPTAVRFAVSGG